MWENMNSQEKNFNLDSKSLATALDKRFDKNVGSTNPGMKQDILDTVDNLNKLKSKWENTTEVEQLLVRQLKEINKGLSSDLKIKLEWSKFMTGSLDFYSDDWSDIEAALNWKKSKYSP